MTPDNAVRSVNHSQAIITLPMLPFSAPPITLARRAMVKLVDNPTINRDSIVPKQPKRRIGLRPMRSERPPVEATCQMMPFGT